MLIIFAAAGAGSKGKQNVDEIMSELQVRDVKDRPILRAAMEAKADVLHTGDRDFLDAG